MKNKYALVIEPFVHTNITENFGIFFNTLDNEIVEISDKVILSLLQQINNGLLLLKENDFLILSKVIDQLRKKFMADIIPLSASSKDPFYSNFDITINELKKIEQGEKKAEILNCLKSINIYLSTKCDKECNYCEVAFKQFGFCTRSKEEETISENILKDILLYIPKDTYINIWGGNLLIDNKIIDYMKLFSEMFLSNINFNINLKNISKSDFKILQQIKEENDITILADSDDLDKIAILKNTINDFNYSFIVRNESDYNLISTNIEKYRIVNYTLNLLYFDSNYDFFSRASFIEESDVKDRKQDIKTIRLKKFLNINFFGTLYILPNGYVYTNLNQKSIGNLKEKFVSRIYLARAEK